MLLSGLSKPAMIRSGIVDLLALLATLTLALNVTVGSRGSPIAVRLRTFFFIV